MKLSDSFRGVDVAGSVDRDRLGHGEREPDREDAPALLARGGGDLSPVPVDHGGREAQAEAGTGDAADPDGPRAVERQEQRAAARPRRRTRRRRRRPRSAAYGPSARAEQTTSPLPRVNLAALTTSSSTTCTRRCAVGDHRQRLVPGSRATLTRSRPLAASETRTDDTTSRRSKGTSCSWVARDSRPPMRSSWSARPRSRSLLRAIARDELALHHRELAALALAEQLGVAGDARDRRTELVAQRLEQSPGDPVQRRRLVVGPVGSPAGRLAPPRTVGGSEVGHHDLGDLVAGAPGPGPSGSAGCVPSLAVTAPSTTPLTVGPGVLVGVAQGVAEVAPGEGVPDRAAEELVLLVARSRRAVSRSRPRPGRLDPSSRHDGAPQLERTGATSGWTSSTDTTPPAR